MELSHGLSDVRSRGPSLTSARPPLRYTARGARGSRASALRAQSVKKIDAATARHRESG